MYCSLYGYAFFTLLQKQVDYVLHTGYDVIITIIVEEEEEEVYERKNDLFCRKKCECTVFLLSIVFCMRVGFLILCFS